MSCTLRAVPSSWWKKKKKEKSTEKMDENVKNHLVKDAVEMTSGPTIQEFSSSQMV